MKKIVTNLLFIKDDKVLLGYKKRGFGAHKYNGFGGKLESGETIDQAAVREAIEESGIKPLDPVKVAVIDFGTAYKFEMHLYISRSWEGTIVETEEMRPQWFSFNNLPLIDMWDDDQYWIDLILKGKKFKASFTFESSNDLDGSLPNKVVAYQITLVDSF